MQWRYISTRQNKTWDASPSQKATVQAALHFLNKPLYFSTKAEKHKMTNSQFCLNLKAQIHQFKQCYSNRGKDDWNSSVKACKADSDNGGTANVFYSLHHWSECDPGPFLRIGLC